MSQAPEDKRCVLDDVHEFLGEYLVATDAQKTAMTLYAAATHAMKEHATMGRMLFTSDVEEAAKTLSMTITASLSANSLDASGTPYALQSALAAATNMPEQPPPTLYWDEISSVFGRSGLNSSGSRVATILRKGYKTGVTDSWSVNRVPEYYSIFTPFLMTGLRTAVPRDIRSRSIVIKMEPGRPARYYDVREAEPFAMRLGESLAGKVKQQSKAIGAFRALGLHPRMYNRKLEVWEPLCAVAYAVGGHRWLTRAVQAFGELALDDSGQASLSPREVVTRDVAAIAELDGGVLVPAIGEQFIGGLAIIEEMKRLADPLYKDRSPASLGTLIRDMVPVASEQHRVPGQGKVRGYRVAALLQAWEDMRPEDLADAEMAEEVNPFDVDEEEEAGEPEAPEAPVPPVPPASDLGERVPGAGGAPVPPVPPASDLGERVPGAGGAPVPPFDSRNLPVVPSSQDELPGKGGGQDAQDAREVQEGQPGAAMAARRPYRRPGHGTGHAGHGQPAAPAAAAP